MPDKVALFPGSFDPFTNGHMDIVQTASVLFDRVEVAIGINASKKPLLTVEERIRLIAQAVGHLENVGVSEFDGLVVNYARKINATVIVRGLRQSVDFEYELRMAVANRRMHPDLPTVFLSPHPENMFVSSTIVRDVVSYGGDVAAFVPDAVNAKLVSMRASQSD